MRLNAGNLTIRNLMISYILLYTIMPIVNRLTSRFLTAYFFMAVVVALVVFILVMDRPENLSMYGSFLLPFIVYGILTYFTTSETIVMWGYQTLLLWLPVILGYYFTQDQNRVLGLYPKLIIFAIVVTMITTTIGCIRNPNASRILATVSSSDTESYTYDMQNIGGYSFVYYMILLYPVLILAFKTKRIKLLPTIIITVVILITTVYSEYTTALLLFIVTSLLFFTKRDLSVRGIVGITVFSLLFLFFFSSVIIDFLHWLADAVNSEAMSSRLDALAGGVTGLEQSEDNRIELYRMSLNAFFANPFLGTFLYRRYLGGGHSFILDNLAQYGILGGVTMFFMYKRVFTRFFLPLKDKPGFGYIAWTFIQAVILSLINTGMWLDVLCLFAPLLFFWIYGTDTKTEEVNDEDTLDSEHAAGPAG